MLRSTLLSIVLALCMFSCTDNDDKEACGSPDPIENLAWLKTKVNEYKSYSFDQPELGKYHNIQQGTYKLQVVFILLNCNPAANAVSPIFDCAGNHLGNLGAKNSDVNYIPREEISNTKFIWKTENNACPLI